MEGNTQLESQKKDESHLLRGERIGVGGNLEVPALWVVCCLLAKGRKDWGGGKRYGFSCYLAKGRKDWGGGKLILRLNNGK